MFELICLQIHQRTGLRIPLHLKHKAKMLWEWIVSNVYVFDSYLNLFIQFLSRLIRPDNGLVQ